MKNAYRTILMAVLITSSGETVVVAQTLGAMTLASYSEDNAETDGGSTGKFLNSCVVALSKNIGACRAIVKKSSSSEMKAVANKMMEEDATLLKQARALAAKLDINVPYNSEINEESFGKGSENEKADVDAAFKTTAITGLEHTIETFRSGVECDDRWTRAFASSSLYVIENQLIQIRSTSTSSR